MERPRRARPRRERPKGRGRSKRIVARTIFGTARRDAIIVEIHGFCETHLGAGVATLLFFDTGRHAATFGVALGDGRRIVVKVTDSGYSKERLEAVQRIQALLHEQGFPCPRPLLAGQTLCKGRARVEELVESGHLADAHDAGVRRALAEALARQVRLTASEPPGALAATSSIFDGPGLWPDKSHRPLHRLHSAPPSPEWIDAIAKPAKLLATEGGTKTIAHSDWSAKNVRFAEGAVRVVYDWDSLKFEAEEQVVGRVSAKFTAHPEVRSPPTPEEARAFVDEYEAGRLSPFTDAERQRIAAARMYTIAFKAYVEMQRPDGKVGPSQRALREFGNKYLEF